MDLKNAQARLTGSAYESQPRPQNLESDLSPKLRFDLLQERFEHLIESRAKSPEGISIELPGDSDVPTMWLRLGIFVEKVADQSEDRDVYLSARWGSQKDAADIADEGMFKSRVDSCMDAARVEQVIHVLELSVAAAEDQVL